METFFLLIVIILIVLAVSDLVVGVSNDAVNFLNSAIGSKAAPFIIVRKTASYRNMVRFPVLIHRPDTHRLIFQRNILNNEISGGDIKTPTGKNRPLGF